MWIATCISPGKGNGKCKSPEVGASLVAWQNNKKAKVAGAVCAQGANRW